MEKSVVMWEKVVGIVYFVHIFVRLEK